MAMRKVWFLAVMFGAACSPARAGAPEGKPPVAIATAEPTSTAMPSTTPVAADAAKPPIHREKARMRWIEGPPSIPRSRMTVLEGNPKEAGSLYTLRISVPNPAKLPPHFHPQDERVTVLEGSVLVGFGDVVDETKATRRKAGDFYVNPAGVHHYVSFDEPTLLQMTGIGPWEVIPVER